MCCIRLRRKTRNVYGMDVMTDMKELLTDMKELLTDMKELLTDMKELSPIVGDIAKTESITLCAVEGGLSQLAMHLQYKANQNICSPWSVQVQT